VTILAAYIVNKIDFAGDYWAICYFSGSTQYLIAVYKYNRRAWSITQKN